MCFLCLHDFNFELPVKPNLDQKKKRLSNIKLLLAIAVYNDVCEGKVDQLKEEQYLLSREF